MTTRELKRVNGLRHNVILRSTYLFIPIKEVYDTALNADFEKELKRYNPKVHRVRSGDNMYKIAHKYGMSLYELMALNRGGVNPKRIRPGQSIIVSDSYYNARTNRKASKRTYASTKKRGSYAKTKHKVRYGESLWSIANKYGTTIGQIKSSNGLRNNVIQPGKRLTVYNYKASSKAKASSKKGRYTVRHGGDNLWAIAKKFGTSITRIKRKNSLSSNNIHPGKVLYID